MIEGLIQLYDCDADADAWDECIGACADVYYRSKWLQMHSLEDGAKGILFVYSEHGVKWSYAFVLREVPECYGIEAYDIESAYGYGGPISESSEEGFLKRACESFDQWCIEQHVIAEFCAFHPLFQNENWMVGGMSIFQDRNTVALSLNGETEIQERYSKDARYMVRRAERGGIEVKVLPVCDYFDKFIEMYRIAMKALDANEFYYFDSKYFEKLKELIQERGWLMVAELNGEWAAASLFMYGDGYLHYHLSANNFEIKAPGATNMILNAAACKGRSMGLKAFHFGGGRTALESDSLLKFKKSMGDQVLDFMIGKRIHDKDVYQNVVLKWESLRPELIEEQANRLLKYRLV